MIPDPVWFSKFVARGGAVGPWTQDGALRWIRRWVHPRQALSDKMEGEPDDVAAVVTYEDGTWGWTTPWDCDAGSEDAATCMKWCDEKLPVTVARILSAQDLNPTETT